MQKPLQKRVECWRTMKECRMKSSRGCHVYYKVQRSICNRREKIEVIVCAWHKYIFISNKYIYKSLLRIQVLMYHIMHFLWIEYLFVVQLRQRTSISAQLRKRATTKSMKWFASLGLLCYSINLAYTALCLIHTPPFFTICYILRAYNHLFLVLWN